MITIIDINNRFNKPRIVLLLWLIAIALGVDAYIHHRRAQRVEAQFLRQTAERVGEVQRALDAIHANKRKDAN